MQRILVTGGAGFIGSHLCKRLLDEGNEVLCLDNFSTGSRRNIRPFLAHPNFGLITHDITVPISLEVDRIYHLASPASPVRYQHQPVMTVRTNVQGSLTALDLARATGATILQASTSEIYGDPEVHPQTESYWGRVNPIGPRSCYDEGKRCAETLFFDYRRQYGIPIKVARIFNTYGPHMEADDGRVVSNFIVQALAGDDITLYGDGSQTRSFCYVADMVEGLVKLMATPESFTGPVNLGNPHEVTMRELAASIIRLTGSRSRLTFLPLPQDDPKRRCPDIALAKRELGWEPRIPFEEGLAATIAHFKKEGRD
ncbi:MAG TPA: SDR family oxidoreductase [bacterium]|nr:SDR family oxidoreductase [bacterium]